MYGYTVIRTFNHDHESRVGLVDSFYNKDRVEVNLTRGDVTPTEFCSTGKPVKYMVCDCDESENCLGYRVAPFDHHIRHPDLNTVEDEYLRRKMERRLQRKMNAKQNTNTQTIDGSCTLSVNVAEPILHIDQKPERSTCIELKTHLRSECSFQGASTNTNMRLNNIISSISEPLHPEKTNTKKFKKKIELSSPSVIEIDSNQYTNNSVKNEFAKNNRINDKDHRSSDTSATCKRKRSKTPEEKEDGEIVSEEDEDGEKKKKKKKKKQDYFAHVWTPTNEDSETVEEYKSWKIHSNLNQNKTVKNVEYIESPTRNIFTFLNGIRGETGFA